MGFPSTYTPFTVRTEVALGARLDPGKVRSGPHGSRLTTLPGPAQRLPLPCPPAKSWSPSLLFPEESHFNMSLCDASFLCPGYFLVFWFSPPGSSWLTEANYV